MNQDADLPVGWVRIALGEVCETSSGGTPERGNPDYYYGSIPWVKSGELNYNIITETEERISEKGLQNSSAKLLPKGTLLIALYGATVGRLATLGIEAATNQAVCAILAPPSLNQRYLYHYLFFSKENLLKQRTGGAQPNISQAIVNNLLVPLPPLVEQNHIVARLETLLEELDQTESTLQQAKSQAEEYRQAVLRDAFSGRLTGEAAVVGELPEGWGYAKIRDIGTVVTGNTPSTKKIENIGSDYFFFKPSDLSQGYHTVIARDKISTVGLQESKLIPAMSVLVTSIGSTIGKTGLIRVEGICNQQINAIIPNHTVLAEYLYFFVLSETFQSQIMESATATTLPIINKGNFERLPIILPPLIAQRKIIESIETHFSSIEKTLAEISQQTQKTQSLRQTLFQDAFTGKLVPQDPADEPATQLLERIKVEKIRMATEQKQRDKANREAKKAKANESEVHKTIVQVLEERGGTYPAVAVWRECEHKGDIEKFYAELKRLMEDKKTVTEDATKQNLLLVP